jgi:hypothetical protein
VKLNLENEYYEYLRCSRFYLPKKKDRVITLRIRENDFNVVENFAKSKGLSVSAYISSVINSQTEFYIPLASTEKVSIPKMVLQSLFSYASKENLDDLTKRWAIEQEHVARLLWGELNLQTFLDVIFKIAKYFMGTNARVITASNFAKDSDYKEGKESSTIFDYSEGIRSIKASDAFQIVIRHNMGENCYFWNKMFTQFFSRLRESIEYTIEYDETTISIKLKVKVK